jgi:hypothetical protein
MRFERTFTQLCHFICSSMTMGCWQKVLCIQRGEEFFLHYWQFIMQTGWRAHPVFKSAKENHELLQEGSAHFLLDSTECLEHQGQRKWYSPTNRKSELQNSFAAEAYPVDYKLQLRAAEAYDRCHNYYMEQKHNDYIRLSLPSEHKPVHLMLEA